jgi:hypothetical protein
MFVSCQTQTDYNLHLSEMEILAQPLCETLLPLDRQRLPPPLFVTQKGCRSEFQNPPIKSFTSKKIASIASLSQLVQHEKKKS